MLLVCYVQRWPLLARRAGRGCCHLRLDVLPPRGTCLFCALIPNVGLCHNDIILDLTNQSVDVNVLQTWLSLQGSLSDAGILRYVLFDAKHYYLGHGAQKRFTAPSDCWNLACALYCCAYRVALSAGLTYAVLHWAFFSVSGGESALHYLLCPRL